MPTITRRIEFDAGHRVLGHEGKCRHIHGHRYCAEVTVTAPDLDDLGRVLDFGIVKAIVGGWVDSNWDHNLLLHKDDPLVGCWSIAVGERRDPDAYLMREMFGGKPPYIMQCGNPTAENIATELMVKAQELLHTVDPVMHVSRVRVYETPNCWADAFSPAPKLEKSRPRTMHG